MFSAIPQSILFHCSGCGDEQDQGKAYQRGWGFHSLWINDDFPLCNRWGVKCGALDRAGLRLLLGRIHRCLLRTGFSPQPLIFMLRRILSRPYFIGSILLAASALLAQAAKPVVLYSRTWNAEGETRYLPDGSYSGILAKLKESCEVRVSALPVTAEMLSGVSVVLIANPSDKVVGGKAAPRHLVASDRAVLTNFVNQGGGLILMGNQENHNLETKETNALLAEFGMKWEERYTDIKGLALPAAVPVIGGLKWGYYSGNTLVLAAGHPAKPQAWVPNDVTVVPMNSTRNEAGVLMAAATPGLGKVVVATDAGWISNAVLEGKGIGGFVVPGDNNVEIFLRLVQWAGRRDG